MGKQNFIFDISILFQTTCMSRLKIKFIIALLCLCLAGILAFQFFWIRSAFIVKEEQFRRSVNEALITVADKLETSDAVSFMSKKFCGNDKAIDSSCIINNKKKKLVKYYGAPNISGQNNEAKVNVTINDKPDSFDVSEKIIDLQQILNSDSVKIIVANVIDTISSVFDKISTALKGKKMFNVLNKMAVEYSTKDDPLEKKINQKSLDSLLKAELRNKDIDINYEYAVVSGNKMSSFHSSGFTKNMINSHFRVNLFPNDIVNKSDFLILNFSDTDNYILKSLRLMLLGAIIFSFIIIVTFAGTIMIILRQKKISDIKTDFINNMTHEFKTPIATISLAIDAINNPKVVDDKEQIKYYSRIIKEENDRMNTHVEHVLQISLLDKKDFHLDLHPVDMNDIILRAVDKIRLLVEKREGSVNLDLSAVNTIINGDENHLLNVMINLLDNANKYSPQKPEIIIATKNTGNMLVVSVTDNGIGMNKEHRTKIFDKFFRVTTGNIQNIKGFGLGLSYSKAIILAHNGTISLSSETGAGSTFEIVLPLQKNI